MARVYLNFLSPICKRLVLSVLTVVFLGQSLTAAASACAMFTVDGSDPQAQMMDHSDHSMHEMDQGNAMDDGHCCDSTYCSMLNCVSLFALLSTSAGILSVLPVRVDSPAGTSTPSFLPSSLFKPPIFS